MNALFITSTVAKYAKIWSHEEKYFYASSEWLRLLIEVQEFYSN